MTREREPTILQEIWREQPLNALLLTLATVSYFWETARCLVIVIMVLLSVITAFIRTSIQPIGRTTKGDGEDDSECEGESPMAAMPLLPRSPSKTLVPGDVVRLSAGDIISADFRFLLEAQGFIR